MWIMNVDLNIVDFQYFWKSIFFSFPQLLSTRLYNQCARKKGYIYIFNTCMFSFVDFEIFLNLKIHFGIKKVIICNIMRNSNKFVLKRS